MHTSKVLFLITAVGKSKRLGSSSSLSWAISFSLILKKDGREGKKKTCGFLLKDKHFMLTTVLQLLAQSSGL